ncbi:MAG: hypothetical protein Q9222_002784 [Ikaeria aurantiellina]
MFPEVWAWGAVSQLIEARKMVKATRRLNRPITLKQAYFILAGGVAIQNLQNAVPLLKSGTMMGSEVPVNSTSVWYRNWKLELSDKEIVMFATHVLAEREIDDKSKQDNLVKMITSLQALWFVVQVAARAQQGLVIAPIQVGTLAYVSMAAFIYGCWWSKPYDVNVSRIVDGRLAITQGWT